MQKIDNLWFNTPNPETLCRGGGNGPNHPSQLYAIKKYFSPDMSFLDYGCGGGTTYEALTDYYRDKVQSITYRGLDIIPKNVEFCSKQYPAGDFKVNKKLHEIDEPDNSWDVVYSRHVVDHMDSFEKALDEHTRVAKELVIMVLWRPLGKGDEHQIKNIVENGQVYENEYTNDYSKAKVIQALEEKEKEGWEILEVAEGVGKEVSGFDTVIVLKHERKD